MPRFLTTVDADPGFRQGSPTAPSWTTGTGAPEGTVAAPVGSIYSRLDGVASNAVYHKETGGAGSTGWVAAGGSAALSDLYVDVAGDTMTGPLVMQAAVSQTLPLFTTKTSSGVEMTHIRPSGELWVRKTSTSLNPATINTLSLQNTDSTVNNWNEISFQSAPGTASATIAARNLDHPNAYAELWAYTRSASGYRQRLHVPSTGGLNVYGDASKVNTSISSVGDVVMTSTYRDQYSGAVLTVLTRDAQATGLGGTITLGGSYTDAGAGSPFARLIGAKTNSVTGEFGGYLGLWTRAPASSGGNLYERLRITELGVVQTGGQVQSASFRQGTAGPTWTSGVGTPENSIMAPVGSIFSRTDGSTGTALYRKETGTGITGWVPVAGAPADAVSSVDGRTGTVTLSDLYVDVTGDNMTGNLGLGVPSPTAKLQLAADTTAAGGILFGADVSIYRSAANVLTVPAALDLSRSELRNAVTQNIAVAPSTPVEGLRYYDSVLKSERYWNGTTWVTSGGGLPAGGLINQTLTKKTNADFDTQWSNLPTNWERFFSVALSTTVNPSQSATVDVATFTAGATGQMIADLVVQLDWVGGGTQLTAVDLGPSTPVPTTFPGPGIIEDVGITLMPVTAAWNNVTAGQTVTLRVAVNAGAGPSPVKITACYGSYRIAGVADSGAYLPPAGATGEALVKKSATNYDSQWQPVPLSVDGRTGALVLTDKYLQLVGGTMGEGANITVGSTTGTKIGTAGTEKLGFWGTTPAIRNSGWSVTGGYTADKTFNPESTTLTEVARTLGTLIDAMKAYGLLA